MTRIFRVALLAALTAAFIPAVAAGQATSTDSLLRRIDLLERKATDLERRIRELEALVSIDPRSRPVTASPQSRDLQNWRRLRLSMTMDQVRALLGEPERVDIIGSRTFWRWESLGFAHVSFENRSSKVDAWSEPRW